MKPPNLTVHGPEHQACILCLHGGPGVGGYFWRSLEPLLDQGIAVATFKQTATTDNPTSFGDCVRGLVAQVRQAVLQLKGMGHNLYVLGHSFGGALALEYIRQHKSAGLAGLILVSWVYDRTPYANVPESVKTGTVALKDLMVGAADVYFSKKALGKKTLQDAEYNGGLFRAVGSCIDEMPDYRPTAQQARTRIPLISIVGRGDTITTPDYLAKSGIPLQKMPGGHFPFVEHPKRFCELVANFVNPG